MQRQGSGLCQTYVRESFIRRAARCDPEICDLNIRMRAQTGVLLVA
jgi:hypothetical protein